MKSSNGPGIAAQGNPGVEFRSWLVLWSMKKGFPILKRGSWPPLSDYHYHHLPRPILARIPPVYPQVHMHTRTHISAHICIHAYTYAHFVGALTLLLFLPAVVSEVGDIIVFHIPFNCFEARACVFFREGVCHVVRDIQVVSDSLVDMAH